MTNLRLTETFILPRCQNLAPTLPRIQLIRQQFEIVGWCTCIPEPLACSCDVQQANRGLVPQLFFISTPPPICFLFKLVVFSPNRRWLKWHHLRQFITTQFPLETFKALNDIFVTHVVVLYNIWKHTLMCKGSSQSQLLTLTITYNVCNFHYNLNFIKVRRMKTLKTSDNDRVMLKRCVTGGEVGWSQETDSAMSVTQLHNFYVKFTNAS